MAGWYAIVKVQFVDKEIKTIGVCLDNAYSISRKEATRVILEELLPQASERIAKKEYGTTKWKLIKVNKMERWTNGYRIPYQDTKDLLI